MMNKLYGDCQIKMANNGDMTFSAYGNVKHVVDKAMDKAIDGCYTKSIANHESNGTTPALLWSHDAYAMPVGKIQRLEEDSKGLFFEGKLSKTTAGSDLHILAKDGAVTKFSIGYNVVKEVWNQTKQYNELHEIDVQEISFVNFACNDESTLQSIKSHLTDGELPTIRELEKLLRKGGLSRKQAMTICSKYRPENDEIDIKRLKQYSMFK
jgi:HK97 family phage prohead protease